MAPVSSLRAWKTVEAWAKRTLALNVERPPACLEHPEEFLAPWALPLISQPSRYKVLYGGRGSGKSYAVADALLIEGARRKIRVLCAREFQVSIKDSVHYLLKERVEALGLVGFYDVQETTILGANGTSFIFKGLRHNIQSVKSTAGITHCWVEEAQAISAESWQVLTPTIRQPGSEIWVTFNPLEKEQVIYDLFVVRGRANTYLRRVNWDENPWFTAALEEERAECQRLDPDLYSHIWDGEPLERSDAQVLGGKWAIDTFEPASDWDGPYHGADWGFGSDPTAAVRLWIHGKRLYVERESLEYRLELDDTAAKWQADIPGIEGYTVRADNARPDSISHVRSAGPNKDRPNIPHLVGAKKGPGSLEDGIGHLRSYEKIVVHPRCKAFAQECRLYSHRIDRLTGDVLPDIVDKHNHLIDSARYALEPLIKQREHQQRKRAQARSNWG